MSPLPTLPSTSRSARASQELDLDLTEPQEPTGRGARAKGWWNRLRGPSGDEETTNWSDGKQMTARATTAGLRGQPLRGAAGSVWSFTTDGGSAQADPAAVQAQTQQLNDREAAAREAAAEMVSVWATSTQNDHARLDQLFGKKATENLPTKALQVSELRTVDADPVAPGVWSVSVSALVKDSGDWQRQSFEVPVMVTGGGQKTVAASAMTLPAQVPLQAEIAKLPASSYTQEITSGPLVSTTDDFLQALLTGAEGLGRVTAPKSSIVAISPAPYQRVEITSVTATDEVDLQAAQNPGEGQRVQLSVDVRLHTTDSKNSAGRPSQYLLTLTSRAGRWEVSSIDDFPATPNTSTTTNNTQE